MTGDVLTANGRSYDLSGRELTNAAPALNRIAASQEFWHSWRSFHPATQKAEPPGAAILTPEPQSNRTPVATEAYNTLDTLQKAVVPTSDLRDLAQRERVSGHVAAARSLLY